MREYVVRRAVLQAIARSGRVHPAAIKLECHGIDEGDVTTAVRRLVGEGLVERASDTRGYVGILHDLRLTNEGRLSVCDAVTKVSN